MNVKKILAVTLVVLFVCVAFVGAASAFTYTSNNFKTSLTGALIPGEHVSSTMTVTYPELSTTPDRLNLNSDLVGVSWTVVKNPGQSGSITTKPSYPYNYVNKFDIYEKSGVVTLVITAEGTVSSESVGKSISSIKLTETGGSASSYTSPPQKVYDTGTLASSLQSLSNTISMLDSAVTEYSAYGDTSILQSNIESARSKYIAAQAAGTADGITAFKNYEAALVFIDKADSALSDVALSMVLRYTTAIEEKITTLYSKGWYSEASVLEAKNTRIHTTYAQYLRSYQDNDNPSVSELNELRQEVLELNALADEYIESSANPFAGIMRILPFILIGVGVIVVGVIVFFLIHKRRNSWDELG